MVRLGVHTSLAGAQGTQPWKLDGFPLQRRQLMACAGGVCTNVAEHGADPKRHMFPPLAALCAPWAGALAGWGEPGLLQTFPSSRCLGRANPTSLPGNGLPLL